MSEQVPQDRPRIKRARFLVDWRHQFAVMAQLLGVLFGVGLLYALGLLVLPGQDAMHELSPGEARDVFLRANAIYFALGAAILGVVSLLLTHRVAGPAYVMERAVHGMRKGDYSRRLNLRRRDYLKDLAAAIEALRAETVEKQETRKKKLSDLKSCLGEGDTAAATELVKQLLADEEPKPEASEEAEDAPSSETEANAETPAETTAV